jgi:KDO2-lipid IV(A) lauroyltransferase
VTRVRHLFEALGAFFAYALFAALPIDWASGLGGWVGRILGPALPMSKVARANLRAVFPDMPDGERERILRAMWDMVGRIVGEYPHLDRIARDAGKPGARVEVAGIAQVEMLRGRGTALLFSAHLGNWEVFAPSLAALGIPYAQVYRDPNNPFVSWLIHRVRRLPRDEMVPKGPAGARKAIAILSKGGRLGMLVDQKMNDGIAVPFFGRDAMTAPALARFAQRYDCPAVPVRLERLGGARFRVSFLPPLDTSGSEAEVMARANRIIEDWIRARPEQWLWIHRRWPKA